MTPRSVPFLLIGIGLAGGIAAQPSSAFHRFKDPSTGQVECAQYAQASDWVRLPGGPYQDQACKVPEPPRTEREALPEVPPGLAPKKVTR